MAKKVGHDLARTRYEVDRTPRSQSAALMEEMAEQASVGFMAQRSAPSATPVLGL